MLVLVILHAHARISLLTDLVQLREQRRQTAGHSGDLLFAIDFCNVLVVQGRSV